MCTVAAQLTGSLATDRPIARPDQSLAIRNASFSILFRQDTAACVSLSFFHNFKERRPLPPSPFESVSAVSCLCDKSDPVYRLSCQPVKHLFAFFRVARDTGKKDACAAAFLTGCQQQRRCYMCHPPVSVKRLFCFLSKTSKSSMKSGQTLDEERDRMIFRVKEPCAARRAFTQKHGHGAIPSGYARQPLLCCEGNPRQPGSPSVGSGRLAPRGDALYMVGTLRLSSAFFHFFVRPGWHPAMLSPALFPHARRTTSLTKSQPCRRTLNATCSMNTPALTCRNVRLLSKQSGFRRT